MRIFLIGFMGSGKSTIGQALAEQLGFFFYDTDEMIEAAEERSIPEIFKTKSELYFREKEKETLHQTSNFEKSIIAVGGGTPCFFDNMDWMNDHGITFHLNMSPEGLKQRLENAAGNRPLLKNIDTDELLNFIALKLEERKHFYNLAHFNFNAEEPEDILLKQMKLAISKMTWH
ncbi:MAG: shikimate kinase [Bacteroidota bacterium]